MRGSMERSLEGAMKGLVKGSMCGGKGEPLIEKRRGPATKPLDASMLAKRRKLK